MDSVESVEVRWFIDPADEVAEALDAWFEGVADEGERVDHYVVLAGRDDLGLKARIRQGHAPKLELKMRLGSLGIVRLAPHVTGRVERWRKLSLDGEDPGRPADTAWVEVHKERRQRKLEIEQGVATEVASNVEPSLGAGVELTRLRYRHARGQGRCWTLGVEAFGPAPELLPALLSACQLAFREMRLAGLDAARSHGYPAWLGSLSP